MNVNEFTSLYLSKDKISVSSLITAYLQLNPSAHPLSNKPFYCESGTEYFLHRLPSEIIKTQNIILIGNTNLLQKYKNNKEYIPMQCRKRKRVYFFNESKAELIVGINSVTDIHDLVSILTGLLVEIKKIKKREVLDTKQFSDSHIEFLRKLFKDTLPIELLKILSKIEDFKIHFIDCDENQFQNRAALWGNFLIQQLKTQNIDIDRSNFYIIMSNSHSIINPLSPFIRQYEKEILEWGQSQSRFYQLYEGLKTNSFWKNDCLYFMLRDFVSQHSDIQKEIDQINLKNGIHEFIDETYNGPSFHCIDLSKINTKYNDERIFDSAIESKDDTSNYVINIDFTMGGYQAKYVLQNVLKLIKNIKGIYIIGKAGSLEGNVGDIILPDFNFNPYNNKLTFFKNDFKAKYIRRYLRRYKIYESHGMLTVLGVLLQNHDLLKYYYTQNFTGIEMECGPYLEAIMDISRDSIENSSTLMLKNSFDFGLAYYISDTPYHQGKTLGTLGFSGVESVYATSISLINRILIKSYSKEIHI